ncbi:hypothetical protein As57867_007749, partial [Aphanomyces stellatus]
AHGVRRSRPDGTGFRTHERLQQALESVGIRCRNEAVFQTLMDSIAKSQGKISIGDFETILQKLNLGNLFEEDAMTLIRDVVYEPSCIEVCDVSSMRLALNKPNFFTSEPTAGSTCKATATSA